MGKNMKEAILEDFSDVIDYILAVTEHDKRDMDIRDKVALSLGRAVHQSKQRGGNISPRESNLYRLAVLLHDKTITSADEFLSRAKVALKKYGTVSAVSAVIKRAGLDFKPVNPILEKEWGDIIFPTPPEKEVEIETPKVIAPKAPEKDYGAIILEELTKLRTEFDAALKAKTMEIHQFITNTFSHIVSESEENRRKIINQIKDVNSLMKYYQYHTHTPDGKVVVTLELKDLKQIIE